MLYLKQLRKAVLPERIKHLLQDKDQRVDLVDAITHRLGIARLHHTTETANIKKVILLITTILMLVMCLISSF